MENGASPLKKYQRQPKLYIDLPSKGLWYNKDIVTKSEELEVYSMTANDEIAIKTPDALFTGNTIKTIIENCVPSIKDTWHLCNIDVDYILAAIRLASYGDVISIEKTCPHCNEQDTYAIPLQGMLDHITEAAQKLNYEVEINQFKFNLRPLSYKEVSENNQSSMKINRTLRQILSSISEEDPEQASHIEKLYDELNSKTKQLVCKLITRVTTPDGDTESNTKFIEDFILNGEPIFFNTLQKVYINNGELLAVPESTVVCSNCEKESQIRAELDYSNFFSNV